MIYAVFFMLCISEKDIVLWWQGDDYALNYKKNYIVYLSTASTSSNSSYKKNVLTFTNSKICHADMWRGDVKYNLKRNIHATKVIIKAIKHLRSCHSPLKKCTIIIRTGGFPKISFTKALRNNLNGTIMQSFKYKYKRIRGTVIASSPNREETQRNHYSVSSFSHFEN